MSLATGGLAMGATSTRSRSASSARRSASSMRTMPTCSPLGPTSRTSGTRIRSLMRGSTLMGPPGRRWTLRPLARGSKKAPHETHAELHGKAGRRREGNALHRGANATAADRTRQLDIERVGEKLHLRVRHRSATPVVARAYQGRRTGASFTSQVVGGAAAPQEPALAASERGCRHLSIPRGLRGVSKPTG